MKNVVLQLSYKLFEFLTNYLFKLNATGIKNNYLYFVKFITKFITKFKKIYNLNL